MEGDHLGPSRRHPVDSSNSSIRVDSDGKNNQPPHTPPKLNNHSSNYGFSYFQNNKKNSKMHTLPPFLSNAIRPRNIFRNLLNFRTLCFGTLAVILLIVFWNPRLSETSNTLYNSESGFPNVSHFNATPFALTPAPCTQGHPNRPLRQFAIMIDAGSTGSRIHVYRFNFCNGPLPTLEDEAFHQLTPGLSSYESDPEAAARSLDPLLEVGLRNVPREMYGCTPIAVKATAGLRLLGKKKSEEILATVERRIKGYPFRLVETDGVVVMEGRDEGVFAWITVNYLLGTILKLERVPTAGIMDLGGGSTQIVFEPDTNLDFEIAEGDHKYILTFGGRQYTLFQHSYLRYGLMESRQRVKQNIVNTSQLSSKGSVCHDVDFKAVAKDNKNQAVELMGLGANFKQCHDLITSALFQKDAVCPKHPCSFDGVYQPPLTETFRHHDIYIFSYFYDRAEPLGLIDAIEKESENEAPRFPVGAIRDAAKVICKDTETEEEFISEAIQKTLQGLGKEKIMKLLKKNPDYCLDLTYMYALLSSGYSIPDERDVRLAKKIKGVETGWCLGAAIHVVDEMFQEEGKVEAVCRIQEIS